MLVEAVHKFARTHPKRDCAFPGWTVEQILWSLAESARDDELYVLAEQDQSNIQGFIQASINHDLREIYVSNILVSSTNALKTFVTRWKELYPDYTVKGRRKQRSVRQYKPSNFKLA